MKEEMEQESGNVEVNSIQYNKGWKEAPDDQ